MRDCLQHRIAQRVTTPEKFKLPAEAPKTGVSSDLGAWAKLADDAPKRAAAAAVTWRTGLAGFVTLLLSVLVLEGADVGDIGGPYRWIAIVSLACGAALAIVGASSTSQAGQGEHHVADVGRPENRLWLPRRRGSSGGGPSGQRRH